MVLSTSTNYIFLVEFASLRHDHQRTISHLINSKQRSRLFVWRTRTKKQKNQKQKMAADNSNNTWRQDLRVGSRVDAFDCAGIWCTAEVIDCNDEAVRIHYVGWANQLSSCLVCFGLLLNQTTVIHFFSF